MIPPDLTNLQRTPECANLFRYVFKCQPFQPNFFFKKRGVFRFQWVFSSFFTERTVAPCEEKLGRFTAFGKIYCLWLHLIRLIFFSGCAMAASMTRCGNNLLLDSLRQGRPLSVKANQIPVAITRRNLRHRSNHSSWWRSVVVVADWKRSYFLARFTT